MNSKSIALVGLSGVGKTTFLSSLVSDFSFRHAEASQIIKAQKEYISNEALSSEGLRNRDIHDNQSLLVDGFHRLFPSEEITTVLDGHTIIDTPTGVIPIPASVFADIGLHFMVYLRGDPRVIASQRQLDKSRNRPERSPNEIAVQQRQAIETAVSITDEIGCPLFVLTHSQGEYFERLLLRD